ncbi:glutathione S-transferase 1-1-like [Bradysia coprophila]|uniref:glutathione S-transferase 1-1-like n=1 Tax=Bradysia coprophila TaxID=38358 RepID=UPI00187D7CC6|nr:glutathione S-transferase 1-1-like [Bradysia coprophila]
MSPTLYHHPVSVPSRAALLTVRNIGLDVQVKVVDIYKGEQNAPEYLRINPLHQVPVYEDGNFVVTESRAIICYLGSVNNKFYPTDLQKRSLVDSRLFFDATNSFPAIRDFARPVLRAGVKKISKDRRDTIITWLNAIELFLGQSQWIAGDEITIADFTFLAHVASAKAFGVDFNQFPKLNDWYNRCKSLPGFHENEEGSQLLADKLRGLLEEPLWS